MEGVQRAQLQIPFWSTRQIFVAFSFPIAYSTRNPVKIK